MAVRRAILPAPPRLRQTLACCGLAVAVAAGAETRTQAQEPPSFKPLRYEEDYGALRDPAARHGLLDDLKFIPLGPDGDAYLSLGGEARERYEYTANPTFDQDPQDKHGVFLQRYVLHGDLHLGSHVRVFGQLYSALETAREGGPSPVDENELELQNAFIDLAFAPADSTELTLRAGRQELRYGSGRLVDVREGPNVRRTFDAARAIIELPDWRVDAFAARPRLVRPDVFDDAADDDKALWGVYATGGGDLLPLGSLDLYYLGYRDDAGRFAQGSAKERRHSIGARFWGEESGWDWNWEALYQFGSFGSGDIQAWTVASETGYTATALPWRPRFAVSANVASGDKDPDDRDLGTFNPLFPRGNYFSEAAVLGPRNFFNVHPFVTVNPAPSWSFTTDVNFFWRLETQDGVYSPSGRLIRGPDGSDARFVGSAVSLTSDWTVSHNLALTAIYTHFFPGAFIKESGPAEDIDFVEITLQLKF